MTIDLSGLWVPIVTPFTESGSLDEASLRSLADRLTVDGSRLVALGTTGEAATLDPVERARVVAVCARAAQSAGRALIVGAGTNSTTSTIVEVARLVDAAQAEGAEVAAVLVVVPYYTRPSIGAIVEHFGIVADASPVPVVAYNVPYRTGRGLDAEALLQTAAHPNVIGVKQAVGALDVDTLELLRRCPADFAVLAGDDAFIAPTILLGGAGAIAAAAHLATARFVELVEAARTGDVPRARQLGAALLPVVLAGFAEPNPAVFKAALFAAGEIAAPTVRRPLTAASPHAAERLRAALASLGS